jgi:hypothetical protein
VFVVAVAAVQGQAAALNWALGPAPLGSDAENYLIWAEALRLSATGTALDPHQWRLYGLIPHDLHWDPAGPLSYSAAIGTRHTLYSAIIAKLTSLGADVSDVLLIQSGLIAFGALAWLRLLRALSGSHKLAACAVALFLVDSHAATAASNLWRESLVVALLPCLFLILYRVATRPFSMAAIVLAAVLGGLLSITRYHLLVIALVAWSVSLATVRPRRAAWRQAVHMLIATAAIAIAAVVAVAPSAVVQTTADFGHILTGPLEHSLAVALGSGTDEAASGADATPGADAAVAQWATERRDGLAVAVLNALSRTFFNPNPIWILKGDIPATAEEGYLYAGMIFVIVLTPFAAIGFTRVMTEKRLRSARVLVALFAAVGIGYCIVFGGFFGRQRVQLLPIFYFLACLGVAGAASVLRARLSSMIHWVETTRSLVRLPWRALPTRDTGSAENRRTGSFQHDQ